MFEVSFNWGEMAGMASVLAISLVPTVTATFLSYRSFRRGWWLAAPGGLFVTLWPLIGFIVYATGGMKSTDGPAFGIAACTIIAGWVTLGLFLTTLAIVGPRLPVLNVGEVF